jgi:hypothetical protein
VVCRICSQFPYWGKLLLRNYGVYKEVLAEGVRSVSLVQKFLKGPEAYSVPAIGTAQL